MTEPGRLLVLGLGNLLCGDDGLGAAAIARLERDYDAPDEALVLDGARLHDRYPRRLVLLGLVPLTLGLGIERSMQVEARLPALVEAVVAEARGMGHLFVPRTEHAKSTHPHGHVARIFGL